MPVSERRWRRYALTSPPHEARREQPAGLGTLDATDATEVDAERFARKPAPRALRAVIALSLVGRRPPKQRRPSNQHAGKLTTATHARHRGSEHGTGGGAGRPSDRLSRRGSRTRLFGPTAPLQRQRTQPDKRTNARRPTAPLWRARHTPTISWPVGNGSRPFRLVLPPPSVAASPWGLARATSRRENDKTRPAHSVAQVWEYRDAQRRFPRRLSGTDLRSSVRRPSRARPALRWRRAVDVGPQLVSRDPRDPLDIETPLRRWPRPLRDGLDAEAQRIRQFRD